MASFTFMLWGMGLTWLGCILVLVWLMYAADPNDIERL